MLLYFYNSHVFLLLQPNTNASVKYRPVIETKHDSLGAFLTTNPGRTAPIDPHIPILMGFNSAETTIETGSENQILYVY